MRQVNPKPEQVQSKQSTSASGKSMKIVNLHPSKKQALPDQQSQVIHKKAKSQNQEAKTRATVHYQSIQSDQQNLHHQNSDAS
jgi:hypothetical protein